MISLFLFLTTHKGCLLGVYSRNHRILLSAETGSVSAVPALSALMVFFFLYETLSPTGTYEMIITLIANCVDLILRMALL